MYDCACNYSIILRTRDRRHDLISCVDARKTLTAHARVCAFVPVAPIFVLLGARALLYGLVVCALRLIAEIAH